jgi:hypothetical protein
VAEPVGWRDIDELAALVGHYCWLEHRLFEMTGRWAGLSRAADGADDALAVWCAAASRRHGGLSRSWAERLPVRAGVDRDALVVSPAGPLAEALQELEALGDLRGGVWALVATVLPWVGGVYLAHERTVSAVSEAPVAEVLVEARRVVSVETQGGRSLLESALGGGIEAPRTIVTVLTRAVDETRVFPAVHPS